MWTKVKVRFIGFILLKTGNGDKRVKYVSPISVTIKPSGESKEKALSAIKSAIKA
jgi:hypothetical protein